MSEGALPANDPIRLGLIGFGRLARDFYLPALKKSSIAVRIVAVADPLESSRELAVKSIEHVAVFADHRAMLASTKIDGLLVASPPSHHLAAWNDAAAAGVPTFLEKPFVLAGQLSEVADSDAARRLLMLNFNRRFWPAYRKIRQHVQSGGLGEFQSAELTLIVNPAGWNAVTSHRANGTDGGALYDLGGHLLDLAWYFLGREPRQIVARKAADGIIEIELSFDAGASATCRLGYSAKSCEKMLVRGTTGVLRIDNPNFSLHRGDSTTSRLLGLPVDALSIAPRVLMRERSMTRYTISASLEAFVGSLRSGNEFPIGFEDAARSARWLEAAMESLESTASAHAPIAAGCA